MEDLLEVAEYLRERGAADMLTKLCGLVADMGDDATKRALLLHIASKCVGGGAMPSRSDARMAEELETFMDCGGGDDPTPEEPAAGADGGGDQQEQQQQQQPHHHHNQQQEDRACSGRRSPARADSATSSRDRQSSRAILAQLRKPTKHRTTFARFMDAFGAEEVGRSRFSEFIATTPGVVHVSSQNKLFRDGVTKAMLVRTPAGGVRVSPAWLRAWREGGQRALSQASVPAPAPARRPAASTLHAAQRGDHQDGADGEELPDALGDAVAPLPRQHHQVR